MPDPQQPVYGASPQVLDPVPSALCAEGLSPASVTGAILWLIRYHFSAASNIVSPALRSLLWQGYPDGRSDTLPDSALVVEPATKWKADLVQARPGVFVRRRVWKLDHLGMFGSAYQQDFDGAQKIERQVSGAHVVYCISRNPGEAEELAWEITGQLEGFSVNVAVDMNMVTFRIAEVPEPAPLEESDKHWVVPVGVTYVFNRAWLVHQASVPLSKFTIGVQE